MKKNIEYKQDEKIYNVKIVIGTNRIFLMEDSLPTDVIPRVGDKILWDFEVDYFVVTGVEHLIMPQEKKFYNYALSVTLP